MKKNKENNKLSFESAMDELEELVNRIDNNKVSLNEMISVFERGTFLTNFCNKELSKVEKKIFKLTKTKNEIKID